MKSGQIANKKVISTFLCCMCFLLVLYCTLSQININDVNKLTASSSEVLAEKVEEDIIDTNELIKKEDNLSKINYVTVGSFNRVILQYSAVYNYSNNPLSVSKGALYFNGHKETYYSQRSLPGTGLNIPGRHVADDGTIRDGDGYICVATDYSYMPKGSVLMTSLGPAKVYDTGCAYGTVDLYVDW